MPLYNKRQLEIAKLVLKEDSATRGSLYMEACNTTVVTNGVFLVKVINSKQASAPGTLRPVKGRNTEKPYMVPATAIIEALKHISARNPNVAIELIEGPSGTPEKVLCHTDSVTHADTVTNTEVKATEGKFPAYANSLPDFKNDKEYKKVGISAKYLKKVCDLLEKYNKGQRITLYVKSGRDRSPIVLTADDGEGTEATAYIVPMVTL